MKFKDFDKAVSIRGSLPWRVDGTDVDRLGRLARDWAGEGPAIERLRRLCLHFSRFPYENVSKILKSSRVGSLDEAYRFPAEVLFEHMEAGFGGTCFSLTAFMETILSLAGFSSMRFLADMPAGTQMHSALLVPLGSSLYLVDPGYLIDRPLLLPQSAGMVSTLGDVELLRESPEYASLHTIMAGGERKLRYRFKIELCPADKFMARWKDSFSWSTSRSLLITKRSRDGIIYLHDRHFREIGLDGVRKKENLRDSLGVRAQELFGLPADAVERAFEIARARRKELKHGRH